MAVYRFRVGFADVDFVRIVFFGDYYRWMDRALDARLLEAGFPYTEMIEGLGVAMPIVESHCVYRAPLRYADEAELPLRFRDLTPRGMRIEFQVLRLPERVVAAEGYTLRRFIDARQFRGINLEGPTYERFASLPSDDAAWVEAAARR